MKSSVVCIISLALIQAVLTQSQFRCDYTFNQQAGGWIKFQEIPANWYEARLRCLYEGSTLASPTEYLKPVLQNIVQTNPSACHGIYTGISATFSSGDYTSVEGTPLSRIPHTWSDCEPNNKHDKEDCLILNKFGDLEDVKCNDTYPYVCYKKSANVAVGPCGTIDNEYVLDSRTGSCYKFHRIPHSWNRANMICRAEGGYLTIINSDVEAQVMVDIFTRNPPQVIISSLKDYAMVGFRDWDEHGEWYTVQGQSLSDAGYNKFIEGRPDNARGIQYCGCIFRNGLLDDIECNDPFSFICEKDPRSSFC